MNTAPPTGRIDVHSHLLPGIDDGCATYEQSLRCARILVEHGYTHAFCTPHTWPSLSNTPDEIVDATGRLQERLSDAGIPLRVLPGGEMNLLQARPLNDRDVVSYGMAGRFALFDFWADSLSECAGSLDAAISDLRAKGLKLILAHPERIRAMQDDTGAAMDWFEERGVFMQLNSWCLTDARLRERAERWLKQNRYYLMGTDLHGPGGMPMRMRGLDIAESLVGREAVERLTVLHPRLLLEAVRPPR